MSIILWVNLFILGRSQRVILDGQISEAVRVDSGVPQGSLLGPELFLVYINDIWRVIESNKFLFANDCIMYRKTVGKSDIDILQRDLNSLWDWAVENKMKIKPVKVKH